MQSDPEYYSRMISEAHPYGIGNVVHDPLDDRNCCVSLNGFDFHPSENCPRKFVIFDQTDKKGEITYHPSLAHKFDSSFTHAYATNIRQGRECVESLDKSENEGGFSLIENTEDIDALLSSGDDYGDDEKEVEDNEGDDMISTGRSPGNLHYNFMASSLSTHRSKSHENLSRDSFSSATCSGESKRAKLRKMVNDLRGIIPGGEQLDTPAVMDEAVRYLKSLKFEAGNLAIEDHED